MVQNALTGIVPIKREKVGELRQVLEQIGDDIRKNPHLRWEDSPSTHFARFVVLDPQTDKITALQCYPPRLLFTSNHDGSLDDYLQELVEKFGAKMERIWGCCEGYTPGACTDAVKFAAFIKPHTHRANTVYIACRGVTVGTIQRSIRIREALNRLLDSSEAQSVLGDLLRQLPASSRPVTAGGDKLVPQSKLASFGEWLVGIRGGPNPNKPVISPEKQVGVEDRVTQNQMTVIVPIRRNPKSWLLVRLILWAVNRVASQSNGSLSGLTTIHFARWGIIDGGRNLFFESNFDGSWENYIDDFVDRASLGMNLIWGNCQGFPKGGCKDIEWFKQYIRVNQIPAQVFYSAYPGASIKNNLNDLQIHKAVQQFLREEEIDLFLSGSYNLGVTNALQTPSAPAKKPSAKLWLLAAVALLVWWLGRDERKRGG